MLLVHSALLVVISVSFKKFGKNIKRISYYYLTKVYFNIIVHTIKLFCVYLCVCVYVKVCL